ncbi:tyrosine-type recombinase/integrase [Methylobacter tundripaludum]|uniref:tyrosine-type recombinase/integrase n=1 Tax=Methylobacter tundripaludum TaxID=173365 RepID=UPI00190F0945|nr:site-specific integrase [Methylobacter tundripaludum]
MSMLIALPLLPSLITAAGDRAQLRFLKFFASNILNPHTRHAYVRAVTEFRDWCAVAAGVSSIIDVEPLHVAAWIEDKTCQLSAPTVKQHLAAIRHLFDWLVTGQIIPANPASSVRGPSHVVKTGKTPILDAEEARRLIASIDTNTCMSSRQRLDRADGLFLRADRCTGHEGGGRVHAKPPPLGAVARERRQAP